MDPLRTVEARWFRLGALPAEAAVWFEALGPPPEARARTDLYLAPSSEALGLKLREGRVEAKRRDAVLGPLRAGRAEATTEAWTKWSFALAPSEPVHLGDAWVEVGKVRRQRRAEVGGGACSLELSEVTVGGDAWWSVCLEAEGPTADARRTALAVAASRWLARPDAPVLPAADARGYPAWLRGRDEERGEG